MHKIPVFLFLLFLSAKLFGQANYSIELLQLDSYESKINYYNKHINNIQTLNTVKDLLSIEDREEHRLELLLFYLKLQAKFDVSIGKSEAYEALRLAERLNKPLQKAGAYESLSGIYEIDLKSDSALLFQNKAFTLAKDLNEPVLESFLNYYKFNYYEIRGNNFEATKSLLSSVELASEYAGPEIKNQRLNHFCIVLLRLGHLSLAEKVMNQIDVNHLAGNRQSHFYVNKAKIYEYNNQRDSAEFIYKKYISKIGSQESYYKLGLYIKLNNELDSALVLFNKSIALKAPEESYFDIIYYDIADIYQSKGLKDSTLHYLQLCLKEAIRLKEVDNEAKAHNALSEFHLDNNDSTAAQNHAELGYAIAHDNNLSEWIVPLTYKLALIHRRNGDFKQALEYVEENNLHTIKLAEQDTEIFFKNAEMSRDIQLWSDKLTAEITAMQAEKMMIYGAAIVLLVLALWLFYLYYEIRKLNGQLVVRNEEVETAMNKFKEAQTQLIQSEKMASLGVLTAGIAHEINNPLNYISGTSTILESYVEENLQEHKETLNPYLTALSTGVERVTKIVNGLNFYSRSAENRNDVCDIVNIINSTLVIVKHQLTENIKIEKEFSFTETIKGNAGKLHQVFLNIITNAIQAIEEKGKILISTEREDNCMIIKVSDTGRGIDSKDIVKISDPFYSNKEVGSGVGLGMYISLDIIKDHNGSLVYQSKKGEGTTAIISMPIIK